MRGSATATFTRSNFVGNVAGTNGAVFIVKEPGTSLIVQDSIIANHTNASEGALIRVDDTADDFAVQLDLVTFGASNAIPALSSTGLVLAQNCDGLEPSDVTGASVGACVHIEEYCMAEACEDEAVGTECYCQLQGVTPTSDPLPIGCMQSAQLAMRVPTKHEVTLLAMKPANVSQEVRARMQRPRRPVM